MYALKALRTTSDAVALSPVSFSNSLAICCALRQSSSSIRIALTGFFASIVPPILCNPCTSPDSLQELSAVLRRMTDKSLHINPANVTFCASGTFALSLDFGRLCVIHYAYEVTYGMVEACRT